MTGKIGHGEAIQCIREIKGIKQEALADIMGDDWTQKKISLLEKKEIIEPEILEQVAKALEVPVESIKNFNKDSVIQYITNNFNDQSVNNGVGAAKELNHCNFNPLDKYVEAMEENKNLYERLLLAEKEKVEMLQKMLAMK